MEEVICFVLVLGFSKESKEARRKRREAKKNHREAEERRKEELKAESVKKYVDDNAVTQDSKLDLTMALSKVDKIKDSEIADKFRGIFKALKQADDIGVDNTLVGDYYKPTAIDLVDSIIRLESVEVECTNIKESKQLVLEALRLLDSGLRHVIDEFYVSDTLKLQAEVKALNQIVGMNTKQF